MNIKQFKRLLDKYPDDMEVKISDFFGNHKEDIFKLAEMEDYDENYDEYKVLCLTSQPFSLNSVKTFEEFGENTIYNLYDTFNLYKENGDCVKWDNMSYDTLYPNLHKNYNDWEEYFEYQSHNFYTVGGLIEFLKPYPKNTKINISTCGTNGIIHKIRKSNVCYFTGVDTNTGDVFEECNDELFFEMGLELYGGNSIGLQGGSIPYHSEEILNCLANPLINLFRKEKMTLSDEEKRMWGSFIESQEKLLKQYYNIRRRLNASRDCNGMYHLKSDECPYLIYGQEEI